MSIVSPFSEPKAKRYPAPKGLSAHSAALWRDVVPRYAKSAGRRALVEAALRDRDRSELAREQLGNNLVVASPSTGVLHQNPLVKIEAEARARFVAGWKALGYGFDQDEDEECQ